MVVSKNLLAFLRVVHRAPAAAGTEELARSTRIVHRRTLYRWQRSFRDLVYFPSVSFEALGLVHVHLFIEEPGDVWRSLPYAVRAEWVVRHPGVRALYLDCLVPRAHRDAFLALLEELGPRWCHHFTAYSSRDAWQVMSDDDTEQAVRSQTHHVWDAIERLPLIVPVIFEGMESRKSLPMIWHALYQRLGNRVWEYLPRFARRLPTNGKRYVRDAYVLINRAGLFRQNTIRFPDLEGLGTPMFVRVHGKRAGALVQAFAQRVALLDVSVLDEQNVLLRVVSPPTLTSLIFSSASDLPAIDDWYVVDTLRNAREPLLVRFAYEQLFDPSTTDWVFPLDDLRRLFA